MKDLAYFEKYYTPVFSYLQKEKDGQFCVVELNSNTNPLKRFFIQDKEKKCRFCGKTEPTVTFKKKAHIFPESLGNKLFVSKNCECDDCNGGYLNQYECDINNFMFDLLSFDGLKGKNGTKKYKTNDQKTTIKVVDDKIVLKDAMGSNNVIFDNDNKKIGVKIDVKTYSQINIYKLLVKMALSILPEEEFNHFKMMANYVKNKQLFGFEFCLFSYYPGFHYSDLTAIGFKRNNNDRKEPSYYFFFFNNNFSFQIPLYNDKDLMANQNENFSLGVHAVPTPFDHTDIGDKKTKLIEPIKNDVVESHQKIVWLQYDKVSLDK